MLNGCWVHLGRECSMGFRVRKMWIHFPVGQTVAVWSLSPFYLHCKVRVTLGNNAHHIGWL